MKDENKNSVMVQRIVVGKEFDGRRRLGVGSFITWR